MSVTWLVCFDFAPCVSVAVSVCFCVITGYYAEDERCWSVHRRANNVRRNDTPARYIRTTFLSGSL